MPLFCVSRWLFVFLMGVLALFLLLANACLWFTSEGVACVVIFFVIWYVVLLLFCFVGFFLCGVHDDFALDTFRLRLCMPWL